MMVDDSFVNDIYSTKTKKVKILNVCKINISVDFAVELNNIILCSLSYIIYKLNFTYSFKNISQSNRKHAKICKIKITSTIYYYVNCKIIY